MRPWPPLFSLLLIHSPIFPLPSALLCSLLCSSARLLLPALPSALLLVSPHLFLSSPHLLLSSIPVCSLLSLPFLQITSPCRADDRSIVSSLGGAMSLQPDACYASGWRDKLEKMLYHVTGAVHTNAWIAHTNMHTGTAYRTCRTPLLSSPCFHNQTGWSHQCTRTNTGAASQTPPTFQSC